MLPINLTTSRVLQQAGYRHPNASARENSIRPTPLIRPRSVRSIEKAAQDARNQKNLLEDPRGSECSGIEVPPRSFVFLEQVSWWRLSEEGCYNSPGPQIAGLILHISISKLISAPGFLALGRWGCCLAARLSISERAPTKCGLRK